MKTNTNARNLVCFFLLLIFLIGCTKEKVSDTLNVNENKVTKDVKEERLTSTSTVHGVIQDKATSVKLSGVACLRKSNSIGTISDNLGLFALIVPIGTIDTLRFFYPGYKVAEKRIAPSDFELDLGVIELELAEDE